MSDWFDQVLGSWVIRRAREDPRWMKAAKRHHKRLNAEAFFRERQRLAAEARLEEQRLDALRELDPEAANMIERGHGRMVIG